MFKISNCKFCQKEIWGSKGCFSEIKIDGKWHERLPYDGFDRCSDCGALEGHYHHLGCDMESCPVCYGQMIWCNCGGRKEALRDGDNVVSLIDVEKEFVVNQSITLRLEDDMTIIYVNEEPFRQCKFLLLNIPVDEVSSFDDIESIDEAAERLDNSLEFDLELGRSENGIPPETEFWGHCSNLQVWVESNYNTKLLHRNLAFPLLKKLTDVGDPTARNVFKEEIAKRFLSNVESVMNFLILEGYLDYLTFEEFQSILEEIDFTNLDLNKILKNCANHLDSKYIRLIFEKSESALVVNEIKDFTYPIEHKPLDETIKYSYRVVPNSGHSDIVSSIAISKDGKYVISGSRDNTVKIWNYNKGTILKTLRGHTAWVCTVAISPDGKYVVSGGMDKKIIVWDFKTGQKVHVLNEHEGSVWSIAITSDSKCFISSSEDRNVVVWDLRTGNVKQWLVYWQDGHKNDVECVKVTSDGNFVVSASIDNTVKIWDLEKMGKDFESRPRTITCPDRIVSIDLSQDDKHIIGAVWDGTIKIWDFNTGTLIRTIEGDKSPNVVKVSPEGSFIISAYEDEESFRITSWEFSTGKRLKELEAHEGGIEDLVFSNDGKIFLSCSEDGKIKAWESASFKLLKVFNRAEHRLYSMALTPDGKRVLTSSNSYSLNIWNFPEGNVINRLKGHHMRINSIKVSKDGNYVISSAPNGYIHIWMFRSDGLSLHKIINSNFRTLNCVNISDDCRYIVGGSEDGEVNIWNFDDGEVVQKITLKKSRRIGVFKWIHSVDISPRNKFVAVGSQDGTLTIWNLYTGELLHKINVTMSKNRITHVEFTRDGKYIAASSLDPIVYLWIVSTGKFYKSFVGGHEDYITTFTFSKDNRYLISGSEDNRVMVSNFDGKEIYGPFQLSSPVKYANIVPGTSTVIAGDKNGDVYAWDFPSYQIQSDIRLLRVNNFKTVSVPNRIEQVTEYDAISYYYDGEIDAEFVEDKEILEENYLDKIILPYPEIYMINYEDQTSTERPLMVYVSNINGIKLRDVAEAFRNYLPKYGDHTFYEGMRYEGDFKGIPVYELSLGS